MPFEQSDGFFPVNQEETAQFVKEIAGRVALSSTDKGARFKTSRFVRL